MSISLVPRMQIRAYNSTSWIGPYKGVKRCMGNTGGFVLFHVVSSPVKRDLKGKWTIRERGTAYACLNVTFLHRDKKRKFSKSDLIRRDYKRKSLYQETNIKK